MSTPQNMLQKLYTSKALHLGIICTIFYQVGHQNGKIKGYSDGYKARENKYYHDMYYRYACMTKEECETLELAGNH